VFRTSLPLVTVAAFLASTTAVRADDKVPIDDRQHPGMAFFESAVVLAIPGIVYWNTKGDQEIDFTLGNNWDSWVSKLTSSNNLRLDTNPFHVNAIRHPLTGFLDYQVVRSNGFSTSTATLVAIGKGVFWEYFLEFRENPSINDIIFNSVGGYAIGEPLYQIGQLWRGSRVSYADRARTALFSPFDAFHDTYRTPKIWMRPSVWRSIDLSTGALEHSVGGIVRGEIAATADIDVVSNRAFAEGGAYDEKIHTGEWSRLRIGAKLGHKPDGTALTGTLFRTQTTWIGRYHQSDDGDGRLFAIGSGFTYRQDWLANEPDRIGIGHLFGPQLQLSRRRAGYEVRWDTAIYGDFALVQALVFSPNPFPRPPPYYSSLQAHGYIDAFGVTATSRLRANIGAWHAELELDAHALHQVVNHDRDSASGGTGSSSITNATGEINPAVTATGVDEQRGFARAQLTYQPGLWGIALVGEGAERRSTWQTQTRVISELSLGAMLQLSY
jgi:hypothetical protein